MKNKNLTSIKTRQVNFLSFCQTYFGKFLSFQYIIYQPVPHFRSLISFPCCNILMSNKRSVLREHSFGNIFKNSMEEIWNSERFRRFRDTIDNPKAKVPFLCTLCRAYDYSERARKYGVDKEL